MSRRKTTEEFILEANTTHNNKYIYSNVNYINMHTKVIITCPAHGDFEQQPANHLQGKGCAKCRNEKLSKERRLNPESLLTQLNEAHNNKYTYNLENYTNMHDKIKITCSIHGEFEQTVSAHLHSKQSCPFCANVGRSTLSTDGFIKRSIQVHGNKYDYSQVNYIGWEEKVTIICKEHGPFLQSPRDHFDGCGCQQCAKHGFDPSKPGILYYLKITTDTNQVLYKIGITNRSIDERFNLTDLAKIEIVKQKLYQNGQDAWDWELLFKRKYKKYQYQGPDILSSGNTELFIEDIYSKFIEESQ